MLSTHNTKWDDQNRLWLGIAFPGKYLTKTEVRVLKEILIQGERGVGRELGISRGTVSTHMQNIKEKLQCQTIVELRRVAITTELAHVLFMKTF